MNVLNLYFDLPGDETDKDDFYFYRELSGVVDATPKKTGQGRWCESEVKDGRLRVSCSVHDPELAHAQIRHALFGHGIARYL